MNRRPVILFTALIVAGIAFISTVLLLVGPKQATPKDPSTSVEHTPNGTFRHVQVDGMDCILWSTEDGTRFAKSGITCNWTTTTVATR